MSPTLNAVKMRIIYVMVVSLLICLWPFVIFIDKFGGSKWKR